MSVLFYPKCCTRIGGGAMGARASVPNQLIGHPASRSRFSVNPASCPLSVSPVTCTTCGSTRGGPCCARALRSAASTPANGDFVANIDRLRAHCTHGYTPGSGPGLMPVSDERVDAYRHAYRLPVRVPGSPRVRGRGTLQRFVSTKHDNGNRHAGLRPPRMRHVGVMV